jgi:hypothetical protein
MEKINSIDFFVIDIHVLFIVVDILLFYSYL